MNVRKQIPEGMALYKGEYITASMAVEQLNNADVLIAKGFAVVADFMPNIGRCVLQDYRRMNEFCVEASARLAGSAPAVCPHGIRSPWGCKECADAVPKSVIDAWVKQESAADSASGVPE